MNVLDFHHPNSDMNDDDIDISSLDSCYKHDVDNLPDSFFNDLSQNLSVLNLNIRSLKSNFGLLKAFLSLVRVPVKVIIITETYLDDDIVNLYDLNGYRKAFINRPSLGGGLMAYIHHTLDFKFMSEYSGIFPTHECLCFCLKCPGKIDINFMCMYRPPSQDIIAFSDYLESLSARTFRKKWIILGDLNVCPLRDANTSGYRKLENFFHNKLFRQLVKYPTFISYGCNPSILDHIWCNLPYSSKCTVFSTPIADHIPFIASFDVATKLPDIQLKFRDFSAKTLYK